MNRQRLRLVTLIALLLATVAGAGTAEARHGHRRMRLYPRRPHMHLGLAVAPTNWYGGAGIVGTRIMDQQGGEPLESGGGMAIWGGLHVNHRLSLELGWLGSMHNPTRVNTWYGPETDYLLLEAVTADARVHLDRSGDFDPYLQGGLGFYFMGRESVGADAVGTGFQLGAGFDFWLGEHVTLGLRALYRGIAMGPPDGAENDVFVSAATVEGSLGLHF
jgi:opacity protein-like surface antigen